MSLSLCSATVANTGEIACDKSRGVLKKIFIFNGEVDSADYADEQTLFNTLVTNSKLSKDDSDKVFVINEAQDIADSSESNTEGTLGLGFKAVLREGRPAYTVKVFAGADLLKRLRKFNNQTVRVLEYDANGAIWGVKSNSKFKGFQAKLFFTGNKLATGQNVEEGIATFTMSILSTSEYFDNAVWADIGDYNIEDVVPLLDVTMAYVSNASNVHQISMEIAGSNLIEDYSIGDEFGTTIATLDVNFSAKSGAGVPATALTITSITYNSTLKTLAVTYDSTEYAAATGNLKLIPPTPAQLDAADVTGIEMLPVTYDKP
jgi:hypothetical protein